MTTKSVISAVKLLVYLLSFAASLEAQNPFPCDGSFYLVNFNSVGSQLEKLVYNPQSRSLTTTAIPLSEPRRKITCLGYSVADQYLYALDFDSYELLRIDARGQISNLGVPLYLDTTLQYYAGYVAPRGRSLVVIGRDPKTQFDKVVYQINILQAPYFSSSQSLISDQPVQIHDLAIHPTLGVIYGFDRKSRRLVGLGTGQVSTFNFPNTTDYLSALYFDHAGNLYGYGNPRETGAQTHYFVDRRTGKMQTLSRGNPGLESDGCSCPYSFDFGMKITPAQVLPCSEITIEYSIFNATGGNWQDLIFRDSLPAGIKITKVEKNSSNLSTVVGGVGSSTFRLINMNLYLESNTIRIKAWVDDLPPGRYGTQAILDFLPALYGQPLVSDNLLSLAPRDSAFFEVVEPKTLKLKNNLSFSCDGDTAFVEAPLDALSYQWSDGSTGKTLVTTRKGTYTLLAKTPCLDYVDTLEIKDSPAPLQAQIQAPERMESGSKNSLAFVPQGQEPFTAFWSVSAGLKLSCQDCNSPVLTALTTGWVYLQLQNARGCVAQDSAFIEVVPVRKVYIPNAFTPNGDQKNDIFFIQGRDGGQILQWNIKDRWGNLVFSKKDIPLNDAALGWDGTFRGLSCGAGAFFYELEIVFPDGERKQFKGEVELLR